MSQPRAGDQWAWEGCGFCFLSLTCGPEAALVVEKGDGLPDTLKGQDLMEDRRWDKKVLPVCPSAAWDPAYLCHWLTIPRQGMPLSSAVQ